MISKVSVPFAWTLRVLRVTLNSELTFYKNITIVVHACNFRLHVLHLTDREAVNTIACSIVCSRLDYCNSILQRSHREQHWSSSM